MSEPDVSLGLPAMADSIAIRDLTPDDLDAVVALEGQTFLDPWPRQAFESLFDYRLIFKGVFVDDRLAAYVLALCFDDYLHLVNIAVAGSHRREGLGRRLVDLVKEETLKDGIGMVLLEVRKDNHAALTLYDKEGFRPLQVLPRYYPDGADALLLCWLAEADGGL